ncbi:nuclear mRNA export, poly(A)+RNA binding protein [Coemansia biformis]|uniref:mRNA export factor MEX67 n=1 Tax=Coemansia biformis TaxID=1286918 RepID=A0A9W7YGM6_9FUNG|nr:nuclear mRNA export, poly(A)+RNA binding protein [Coemansia biformis]
MVPFGGPGTAGYDGGPVHVTIKGWRGGTESALMGFLDRKVGRSVGIADISYHGDIMHFSVPSMDTAQELLRLSGIRFAGDRLSFQINDQPAKPGLAGPSRTAPGSNRDSASVRDRLVALLQARADAQGTSLDLSSLPQDNIIQSLGADPLRDDKLFKALLVLAAQLYPGIAAINLANNGLSSLKPVADIGAHFPKLKSLSLMNNMLSDFRELDCLSAAGSTVPLRALGELVLVGNPVSEAALRVADGGASYVDKIQQRFPTVGLLDMTPVPPRAQADQPPDRPGSSAEARQPPFPTAQSFVENQDMGDLANGFLASFFGLYDSNRRALADMYDQAAQFSLMVDTAHPTSAFVQTNPDSQKRVDLSAYIRISRNLARTRSPQKRLGALILGRAAITQTITQLPRTQHPVQDAQRFSFDVWQANVGSGAQQAQTVAVVVVHGEFTELPSQSVISFDRMFVLAPAQPGTPAAAAGSPCTITNDQLTIRRYNGFHSWLPPAPCEPALAVGLAPEQEEMARALQEATGLNAEWTLKCLENYGWNYQQAMSEFPQVRASLPPEAFQ